MRATAMSRTRESPPPPRHRRMCGVQSTLAHPQARPRTKPRAKREAAIRGLYRSLRGKDPGQPHTLTGARFPGTRGEGSGKNGAEASDWPHGLRSKASLVQRPRDTEANKCALFTSFVKGTPAREELRTCFNTSPPADDTFAPPRSRLPGSASAVRLIPVIVMPLILAPFFYISMHIIQAPGIGWKMAHIGAIPRLEICLPMRYSFARIVSRFCAGSAAIFPFGFGQKPVGQPRALSERAQIGLRDFPRDFRRRPAILAKC